ncbi:MAG: nicotinate-nucleotide--dimethylbenzimidazole phosphoribosyltransferase [Actinomycetales bacterium]|nr:nicotinate-nucleotide--dimethylbenzimidazole phosphoribosyltransferase [Actinomycetales bacterium]
MRSLEELGDRIAAPERDDADPADPVGDGPGEAHGLLADLVRWWSLVRGGTGLGPPDDVLLLRLVPPGPPVPPSRPPVSPAGTQRVSVRAEQPPTDVEECLGWGRSVAETAADTGVDLLLLTVDDRLPALAVTSSYSRTDAVRTLGWPTSGAEDAAWTADVAVLRDLLWRLRSLNHPQDVLEATGSPGLIAGTAVLLASAARRTPVLLDGYGSLVCAMLAARISTAAPDWWRIAAAADDRASADAVAWLGTTPLIRLGITAQDGTGALLGLGVLDAVTAPLGEPGEG